MESEPVIIIIIIIIRMIKKNLLAHPKQIAQIWRVRNRPDLCEFKGLRSMLRPEVDMQSDFNKKGPKQKRAILEGVNFFFNQGDTVRKNISFIWGPGPNSSGLSTSILFRRHGGSEVATASFSLPQTKRGAFGRLSISFWEVDGDLVDSPHFCGRRLDPLSCSQ